MIIILQQRTLIFKQVPPDRLIDWIIIILGITEITMQLIGFHQ